MLNNSYFPSKSFGMLVSGGCDSVGACHYLAKKGFDLFVIHVNQRYIKSDDLAAQRVAQFCEDNNLKYQILTPENKMVGNGVEDSSRRIRWSAIRKFCKENPRTQLKYLCAAHILEECVESYINRMLHGELNYAPIPPICEYEETTVFRPFMEVSKRFFREYLNKNNLEQYITEDPLNYDTKLRRAFIRHSIVPLIESKYKGLNTVVKKIMKKHMENKLVFS